ncbi:MAG: hypothetical protein N2517_01885 [Ignavibacteria bacterium]|nr:hypothetical protein [Ignavibacteria bacterium]
MKRINLFVLVLIYLFGCAKENPLLINPPLTNQNVKIRLLNAVPSSQSISLEIDGPIKTESIGYLKLSQGITPPPFDSISIKFFQDQTNVYQPFRKIRIIRETKYLIIAGESFRSNGFVDTFLTITTTYGLPKKQGKSYFKFVNLLKDSTLNVSIVEGCPNGTPLLQNVPYFSFPFLKTVNNGKLTFSVIFQKDGKSSLFNTYEMNFEEDKEYTLLLAKNKDNSINMFIYDDYDTVANELQILPPLAERKSFVRPINLTDDYIDIYKHPSIEITSNFEPNQIGKYYPINACESSLLDTLSITTANENLFIGYSFEVNKRYSLIIVNESGKNKKLFLLPSLQLRAQLGNKVAIQVVNALDSQTTITLSLGGRHRNNSRGYVAGEILASNLPFGKVSEPAIIEKGPLPLTLFLSREPNVLLETAFGNITEGGLYFLVIYKNQNNEIKFALISENQEESKISNLQNGYFLQILNANPEFNEIRIEIPKIIESGKILYKETFATVIPMELTNISVNSVILSFHPEVEERGLLVIAGDKQNLDIFDISHKQMGQEFGSYRRRFLNAYKSNTTISFRSGSETGYIEVSGLAYGQATAIQKVFLERKFSLFVFDENRSKLLSQFNDIHLTFGKNYTLVFSGNETKGFALIVVQEY